MSSEQQNTKPNSVDELKTQIRSEEVQEILSYVPHWMVRWGITLLFVILLCMLIGSWLIKYPDVLTSKITITTVNPPARIVAKSSAQIDTLFVSDGQMVKKDDYLGILENGATSEHVLLLKKKLDHHKEVLLQPSDTIVPIDFSKNLALGDIQSSYSSFVQAYLRYVNFKLDDYALLKIKSIETQIEEYKKLTGKLANQKEIQLRELELEKRKYAVDQELFSSEVISQMELDKAEAAYLQKKYALENMDIAMINNSVQIIELSKNAIELKQQHQEKERELVILQQENLKSLLTSIENWEQLFSLKSPIAGQVSFFQYWSKNQFITSGSEAMTITPNKHHLIGKVFLPGMGAGKVKIGQTVRIKLDEYPNEEFGIIEGKVTSVSNITREGQYVVNVDLPNGLTTTYKKTLPFNQEMQGTAEIVTDDLRLLERVFHQFLSLMDNV